MASSGRTPPDESQPDELPYYGPLGGPEGYAEQRCDDDEWLEYRWLITDGIYVNVEVGEGPASWV
jgi:hypothetical protein